MVSREQRSRRHARSVKWSLALLLIIRASSAKAEAPSCFAERTVLAASPLVDAEGRRFGVVRAGHVVRVIADRVGENGALAEVEVDGALPLRGRVSRNQLVVFGRGEIELTRGSKWLRAHVPLRILDPDGPAAVRATWA